VDTMYEKEPLSHTQTEQQERITVTNGFKDESRRVRHPLKGAEALATAGELASSLAHSVRNPLASVRMRLYSLGRLTLPPDQEEDLGVICEEIDYIDEIVESFLKFSRPPTRKKTMASPSDVVDAAVALFRDSDKSHGVEVHIFRHHRLPEIWIDAAQLKEALLNLLFNGGEAIGNDHGAIRIEEEKEEITRGSEAITIQITDNGVGISEAVREKMFQPFFTTKGTGTGLGLCIAKRIVEAHGGRISMHSGAGHETTVTLTLPSPGATTPGSEKGDTQHG